MRTKIYSYVVRASLIIGLMSLVFCFLTDAGSAEFYISVISTIINTGICLLSSVLLRKEIYNGKDET